MSSGRKPASGSTGAARNFFGVGLLEPPRFSTLTGGGGILFRLPEIGESVGGWDCAVPLSAGRGREGPGEGERWPAALEDVEICVAFFFPLVLAVTGGESSAECEADA